MENLIAHTWWVDVKNRTWLILSVPFTPYYNENKVLCFKPSGYVTLLEYGKSDIIEQPYELIKEFINNKTFKPISI